MLGKYYIVDHNLGEADHIFGMQLNEFRQFMGLKGELDLLVHSYPD